MPNDLYLHVVKQDLASPDDLKRGFAAFSDSKYYDPNATLDEVERGQVLISKMPSYWIASLEAPVADEIEEFVGEDFPTLSTLLKERILESLSKNRVPYKQVRPDSRGLLNFFNDYANFQCFTFIW